MYLKNDGFSYYTNDGTQHRSRGLFLMLVQDKNKPCGKDNFRALVRKVALKQLGPWMMGHARVKGETLTISGAYGSDGLPMSVSKNVYDAAVDVPSELYDAWAQGGGWNSAGNEAKAMRDWALNTIVK
jgi:hypothetical protein